MKRILYDLGDRQYILFEKSEKYHVSYTTGKYNSITSAPEKEQYYYFLDDHHHAFVAFCKAILHHFDMLNLEKVKRDVIYLKEELGLETLQIFVKFIFGGIK